VRAALRTGPLLTAALAGIVGGLVFASLLLLVEQPSEGLRFWAPVALATAVALGAAIATQIATSRGAPESAPSREPAIQALNFSAAPPGGLLATAEAMVRFDEELRLAAEYARPLCVALLGLDAATGVDRQDALEALRQLTAGAVRGQDVVTDRGGAEVLLLLLETTEASGWVVAERIHQRISAVGVGVLRCVLVAPAATDSLREVLDELDSGLEACREMNVVFADPTRQLARTGPA
jgi:GGDEF domain-containing protein